MKRKIYCIGNAHLDPAWMWCWQEGSAAAKATIRSALDRMKEFPDFKFVCAGTSVYQWIEEFDPKMFAEIKERVKQGRFIPVGGWHVQPDCNIPSGEGFARQSLYSQRYFLEKFGVTASIGYNVDSFGHNGNIPMILRKSGMTRYVYMRPSPKEMPMPSAVFKWQSADGSAVTAFRIHESYCMKFDTDKILEDKLEGVSAAMPTQLPLSAMFYGVGNHGGGPTIRHIELIQKYNKKYPKTLIFSTLTDLFDDIENQKEFELPVHCDDLQHHASGCYSAFSPIKTAIRKSETALVAAEVAAILATQILGRKYPMENFKRGWQNVCFIHFHDICGGCCIKDAYDDALAFAGEAISIASKAKNNALQSLSWAINTSDATKGTPVVVFNPHSFDINAIVRVNLRITSAHDDEDNELPIQHIQSQTLLCGRRTDSLFRVKVPAFGYVTYYIDRKDAIHGVKYMAPEVRTRVDIMKHFLRFPTEVSYTENTMEDDFFKVEFDGQKGYLTRIFDKKNDKDLLISGMKSDKKMGATELSGIYGAFPIVIDESDHDTWSHAKNYFDNEIGYFKSCSSEYIERGPLRVTKQFTYKYGNSKLMQRFTLANDGLLRVNVKLDWHEKQKMLKICYPLNLTNTRAIYEIPFGSIVRPTNGEEECGQMWIATLGNEGGVAMLNDNKYSFSVRDNRMSITAIRSPYFGDHGWARYANDRTDVTDQGSSEFNYAIMPYTSNSEITKAARLFNTPPEVIVENNHLGTLNAKFEGITCDKSNIIISAIKRAENGKGLVLRVYESDGKDTEFTLSGGLPPIALHAEIGHNSVETYYLEDGAKDWRSVLITEL